VEPLIAFDDLLSGDGNGDGYGYGYGNGSGSGSGSGYGNGNGSGSGSGSGYGNGYGDGNGNGNGSGSGSGSGYGYGNGYGYGDGNGNGNGYGSGSGSGYGNGNGDGNGYGDGDGPYYAALTDIPQAAIARKAGAVIALWKSNADGRPANGGSLSPVKIGDIHETNGPLDLCHAGTLHATFNPGAWQGERWWVVALYGEVAIGDNKLGALKREILAELT
jgi:hypothetical protein